jgi:hypothetical protein
MSLARRPARATASRRRSDVAGTRARRSLVRRLRRLAAARPQRDPVRRHYVCLLQDRIPDARGDLLELAALIERAPVVDPGSIAELRVLLTSGCESPLYNPDVHVSELHASLYFLRARLQGAVDSSWER